MICPHCGEPVRVWRMGSGSFALFGWAGSFANYVRTDFLAATEVLEGQPPDVPNRIEMGRELFEQLHENLLADRHRHFGALAVELANLDVRLRETTSDYAREALAILEKIQRALSVREVRLMDVLVTSNKDLPGTIRYFTDDTLVVCSSGWTA